MSIFGPLIAVLAALMALIFGPPPPAPVEPSAAVSISAGLVTQTSTSPEAQYADDRLEGLGIFSGVTAVGYGISRIDNGDDGPNQGHTTPVPEPASAAVIATGGFFLLRRKRRRV